MKYFIILILMFSFNTNASERFFDDKARGWHWYEEVEEEVKEEEFAANPNMTPTEQIEHLRKEAEKKLHQAIVSPTNKNLIAYMKAQKIIMDQGGKFADKWKTVLYQTPELDESLKFPSSNAARHLYIKLEGEKKKKILQGLSKEYGLFFFFRGQCKYCHAFAPHIQNFARKYNWDVMAISLDGGKLPQFPNARNDNGIALQLNIKHVPALIAVHPQTQEMIPLAYGMISESEIEERALKLSGGKK